MLLRKKEPVSDVFTYKRAFAKKINACACEKTMHNTHGSRHKNEMMAAILCFGLMGKN